MRAILLVDHGSRRSDAHQGLMAAADSLREALRERMPDVLVAIAHMEISDPSIEAAYRSCAEAGADSVDVVPCFLSRGKHVTEDVPALVARVAAEYPRVSYRIGPPLLELPGFTAMLVEHLFP